MSCDQFVDYTKVDLVKYLSESPPATRFHIFLDAVGLVSGALYYCSEKYLAPKGVFVSVSPEPHGFGDVPQFIKYMTSLYWPGWLGGVKRGWK